MLKTLIVDDEPVARKVLRDELELVGDIEIVGEADNGAAALRSIVALQPDLVFLDLQMPILGGLDVVRNLNQEAHAPVVVFVTAYDKFALEAFEAGAVDYLLKPIRQERLAEAIKRARRLTNKEALEKIGYLQEIDDPVGEHQTKKIIGRAGEEYFLLDIDEIYAFQAEGDSVSIITPKQKYLTTQSLKILQQRLKDSSFRRIHRNALVNVDHVRKMSVLSSQRWLITLSNDQEFIASKRQARNIRQLLRW